MTPAEAAYRLRALARAMPGVDGEAIAVLLGHVGELERTLEQVAANHASVTRHWPEYAVHLVPVRAAAPEPTCAQCGRVESLHSGERPIHPYIPRDVVPAPRSGAPTVNDRSRSQGPAPRSRALPPMARRKQGDGA